MKWFLASALSIILILQSMTIDAGIIKRRSLRKAIESSVYISGLVLEKNEEGQMELDRFHGSGVVILPDGYIVTCYHVVRNSVGLNVICGKDTLFPIIVGVDTTDDIALLKVDKDLPCIAKSGNVRLGDKMYDIGFPLDLGLTLTDGIISSFIDNRNPNSNENDIDHILYLITSAPLNAGGSGGGLLDENYKLIGINCRIVTPTGYYIGYGISIPLAYVMNSVSKILRESGYTGALPNH